MSIPTDRPLAVDSHTCLQAHKVEAARVINGRAFDVNTGSPLRIRSKATEKAERDQVRSLNRELRAGRWTGLGYFVLFFFVVLVGGMALITAHGFRFF